LKARLVETSKAVDKQGSSVAELTQLNEKLTAERATQQQQLDALTTQLNAARADAARLAGVEQARQEAEQRVTALANASTQLTAAQHDLATARAETARLGDQLQATERDRNTRLVQAQQENAALGARLRQAQTTLDQIASAARLINSPATAPSTQAAPVRSITNATPNNPVLAAPEPAAPAPRYHVVAEGDSLTRISMRYYGTSTRWNEIYDANREVLKGENALRPGQRLQIP
jgi:nucleoid-associated protein YgaU